MAVRSLASNRAALAALTLGSSAIVLTDATVPTLAPQLHETAHLSLTAVGWIGSSYSLTTVMLVFPAIFVARRLGQSRALVLGLVLFAAGTAALAFATSFATFIAARSVQGAATALVSPTMLACLRRLFAPQERSHAIAVWSGVSSVMLATGPLIGAAISTIGGWRLVFVVYVAPAAVAALSLWRAIPGSQNREQPTDRRAAIVATVAFALVDVALTFGGAAIVGAIMVSVAVAGFHLKRRHARCLISGRFSTGALASLLTSGLLSSLFFVIPMYDEIVLGMAPSESALSLTVIVIPFLFVGLLAARWSARNGTHVPMVAGAVALATAFVGGAQWSAHDSLADTIPVLFLAGAGLGALMSPSTSIALGGVPAERAGEGAAKLVSARTLGVGLSIWSTSLLIARQPSCNHLLHACLDAISGSMLRPFVLDALAAAGLAALTLYPSAVAATAAGRGRILTPDWLARRAGF